MTLFCVFCGMCFGYTDVDCTSYARVGAFINAPSKILFAESMYSTCMVTCLRGLSHFIIEVLHTLVGFNIGRFRAVLMGTKSCTKILILPKIFPTRFRFTFYG